MSTEILLTPSRTEASIGLALRFTLMLFLSGALLLGSCGSGGGSSSTNNNQNSGSGASTYNWNGNWTLVWSDEFNGTDGSAPDSTKWTYDLGAGGWGNSELETYTNSTDNAQVSGGNLVITARKVTDSTTGAVSYTSARLKTQGLFSQQYGRFEARVKVPAGQGMWPAFWMLGNNITTAGWPSCGETDIMENIGSTPATDYGTLHAPSPYGATQLGGSYTLTSGKLSDDYHVYAVEWEPQVVRFYIDSTNYKTIHHTDFTNSSSWVFDQQPMFMILNLAVGGSWPGNPDAATQFPQQMLVDYVRVYKRE